MSASISERFCCCCVASADSRAAIFAFVALPDEVLLCDGEGDATEEVAGEDVAVGFFAVAVAGLLVVALGDLGGASDSGFLNERRAVGDEGGSAREPRRDAARL